MDKQQLLAEVRIMAQRGEISEHEVLEAFENSGSLESGQHKLNIAEILYYIGGAIVFLGIAVLASQNWDSFGSAIRILITLGSSIAAFIVAGLLYSREGLKKISQSFFLISGLLAPVGLTVTFHESGMDIGSRSVQILVYLILASLFLGSLKFFKQTILLFFGIVFSSILFGVIVSFIVGDNLLSSTYAKVIEYTLLTISLAWVFLGYYFRQTTYKAVTGTLYSFGILGVLGITLYLGGYSPEQNVFWELVYPLIVFGVIFLSVHLKSKSFLVFGSLFLIGYILKLTSEYFSTGLGWPLALVLAGLGIIAVGYWAVRINSTYLQKKV